MKGLKEPKPWLDKYYFRIRQYGIPRRWGIFTNTRHWEFLTFEDALRGLYQIHLCGEKWFKKEEGTTLEIEKIMGSEPDIWHPEDNHSYHPRVY